MARRLARTARRAGLGGESANRIVRHFERALAERALNDPEHHAYLHPARNALILIEDVGVRDVTELCAAIRFDATRPAPHVEDPDVAAFLETVPRPRDDPAGLLEELVTAPEGAVHVALADQLDHARHLHLGPADRWAAFHRDVAGIYLPAAERTDSALARRFRWWTDMFARRWLPRARA